MSKAIRCASSITTSFCSLLSVGDARATSLIAIVPSDGSAAGLACLHRIGDKPRAEFAILVRSDLKGHGVGWRLMERLVAEARAKCYDQTKCFDRIGENVAMRDFCRSLGFHFASVPGDPTLTSVVMTLTERPGEP